MTVTIARIHAMSAALLLTAITATIIPLMIRRYVSNPLAELSRKVTRFSSEDEDRGRERNEVRLLNEEFRRLDQQLSEAHAALIEKHRRESLQSVDLWSFEGHQDPEGLRQKIRTAINLAFNGLVPGASDKSQIQ